MPLQYISLDNFRVFNEKTEFEFAPITILTGTNSSGKSSLVDALRILQEYTDAIPDSDSDKFWDRVINLKEDYLHNRIANFKDLINYNTGRDEITFEFKCNFIGIPEEVTLIMEFKSKNGNGYSGLLKSLKFRSFEDVVFFSMEIDDQSLIHLELDYQFLQEKFYMKIRQEIIYYNDVISHKNDIEYLVSKLMKWEHFFLNPFKFTSPNPLEIRNYERILKSFNTGQPFYDKIIHYEKYNIDKPEETNESSQEKIKIKELLSEKLQIAVKHNYNIDAVLMNPVEAITYSNFEDLPYIYNNNKNRDFLWKYFNLLNDNSGLGFNDIGDYKTELGKLFYEKFIGDNIYNSIASLKEKYQFTYVSSTRNSPDRFYRKEGAGSFGNLLSEYLDKNIESNVVLNKFLNKYLLHFDIGESIVVERNGDGVFNIHTIKQGKKINLVDLGFGISQIMPILLQILLTAFDDKVKSIIIEEPETNLHPALQSKLADMIIDAYKVFQIQFILETHSEYFIRKLQYLTAQKEINPEDSQIYYFYHPDNIPNGQPQVKKININSEGAISDDFGTGFFDEADNIAIDLYNLFTQSRHN